MSSPLNRAPGAPAAAGVTSREMAPHRVRGRALAARVLRETLASLVDHAGNADATQRSVAADLGISPAHMQRLCGDGDPAIALGDVLAMDPTIAAAILRAALAAVTPAPVDAPCAQGIACGAAALVGQLAAVSHRAVADGRVTTGEWREIDACLDAIAADVARSRAEVRAAIGRRR